MITRIDHIAIAVNSIEETLQFYSADLGLELSHTEVEEGQGVTVAFLPVGESEVELIEPMGDDSPISRFLEKRGEGLHHVCFEVEDIEAALARLKTQGAKLINEEPYIGARGQKLVFVHPRSTHGVLIELYETSSDGRS